MTGRTDAPAALCRVVRWRPRLSTEYLADTVMQEPNRGHHGAGALALQRFGASSEKRKHFIFGVLPIVA